MSDSDKLWTEWFDNPQRNSERSLWRTLTSGVVKVIITASGPAAIYLTVIYNNGKEVELAVALTVTEVLALISAECVKGRRKNSPKVVSKE